MRELLNHGLFLDANYSYCERTMHESHFNQYSNHCASEHFLWHFGQLFLFVGYLFGYISVTYHIRRYKYMSVFRICIVLSSILLLGWADALANAQDHVAYQAIFFTVNIIHLILIACYEKPITLNDYLHNLWHKMFNMNGYNLELLDFYNLLQEKAFLKTYRRGAVYIEEGDIPQSLSILLSGKMSIWKRDDFQRKDVFMAHQSTKDARKAKEETLSGGPYKNAEEAYCGAVYPYEFIDSYEWLMCQGVFKYEGMTQSQDSSGVSQVTIRVSDDKDVSECVILTWKKEALEAVFKEHPRLRVCIHSLVGKDIADKMLRITGHASDISTLNPDVDMVRKANGFIRPTLRADVKNAHQTELERQVLPVPANRAATILDDKYTQVTEVKVGVGFPECDEQNPEHFRALPDGKIEQIYVQDWWSPAGGRDKYVEGCIGTDKEAKLGHTMLASEDTGAQLLYMLETGKSAPLPEGADTSRPIPGFMVKTDPRGQLVQDDTHGCLVPALAVMAQDKDMSNLTDVQANTKARLGAGPWCDLPDEVLRSPAHPWRGPPAHPGEEADIVFKQDNTGNFRQYNRDGEDMGNDAVYMLEQAMHRLQRSRLRVTNARLLGVNPGALESLQPSSDVYGSATEAGKRHGNNLLKYFEENMPELKKKDLHEILKWGRWRTFYREGTQLVRQGEEAHYVGLVLQGRLALYTEDEITRSQTLVTYVDKYDLVGSEDFSSKFRTARRTIQMPKFVKMSEEFEGSLLQTASLFSKLRESPEKRNEQRQEGVDNLTYEDIVDLLKERHPQLLTKTYDEREFISNGSYQNNLKEGLMYEMLSVERKKPEGDGESGELLPSDAENFLHSEQCRAIFDQDERTEFDERIKKARSDGKKEINVTRIPTVMFMWDIKDIKRLMLADPHVESSLSTLLRSDITYKLNSAAPSALGTRLCGVPTQARGDQEIRACGISND